MGTERRAVLYARKSRYTGDGDSKSVLDQLTDCRRYAEGQGWTVVAELKDDNKSGHTLPWQKRPEFAQAVDIFQRREADVFVTLWTSRLSRDDEDRAALPRMLAALDVEWYAVEDGGLIETETYAGYMMDGFRRLMDVGESKRKSEIWRATGRRRIEAGLPKNGLPRFGYIQKLVPDGKGGEKFSGPYSVDAETGPLLRDAYLRYTAGADLTALAKSLGMSGGGALGRVLDSGFGAGLIIDKQHDTYTDGAHEPVITPDEWTAYLDVRKGRRAAPPKRRSASWYLQGIVCCSLCGYRMHARPTSLICGTYKNKGKDGCEGTFIKRDTVERVVTAWIAGNIGAFPLRDAEDTAGQTLAADLEDRLTKVHARLTRLATLYADDEIDAEGYRGAQAEALALREDLEGQLRAARMSVVTPLTKDEWSRIELGEDVSTGEWNALLARVLRRVEVHPDRIVVVPMVGDAQTVQR